MWKKKRYKYNKFLVGHGVNINKWKWMKFNLIIFACKNGSDSSKIINYIYINTITGNGKSEIPLLAEWRNEYKTRVMYPVDMEHI